MQERIEPPILISRLMTFVMATSLVVLVVLVVTLNKMFPLNRPQVFVLTTQNLNDKELTLTEMPQNLEKYKQNFVKEYVRERNEIVKDLSIMRAKWANSPNGVVKTRSTDAVFGQFAETRMVNTIYQNLNEFFDITCDVDFPVSGSIIPQTNATDTYVVQFLYTCRYGAMGDQVDKKRFNVRVKLQPIAENSIKWVERLENPLGFRVSSYEVINGQDPLNFDAD